MLSIDRKYLLLGLPLFFSLGKIVLGNAVALVCSFVWICTVLLHNNYNKYSVLKIRTVITFLLVFVVFSFLLTTSPSEYLLVLIDQNLVVQYFALLFCIYSFDIDDVKKVKNILLVSAICFILFFYFNMTSIFQINGIEAMYMLREENMAFDNVTKRLCICCGFILLLGPYLKKNVFLVAVTAMTINLIAALYLGRRNVIVTSILFIILSGYRFLLYQHMKRVYRYLLIFLLIIGAAIVVLNILASIQDNDFFNVLYNKWDRDNRSTVSYYFYDDMEKHPFQWLIGKGISSSYYCPDVVENTLYRSSIETGWQHIILKLGLPFLIVYLWIQLKSIYKCRKNFLTTACACYILIMIVELLYAGVPTFDLRYVLIWFCVSLCNNRRIGQMKNEEIKKALK